MAHSGRGEVRLEKLHGSLSREINSQLCLYILCLYIPAARMCLFLSSCQASIVFELVLYLFLRGLVDLLIRRTHECIVYSRKLMVQKCVIHTLLRKSRCRAFPNLPKVWRLSPPRGNFSYYTGRPPVYWGNQLYQDDSIPFAE